MVILHKPLTATLQQSLSVLFKDTVTEACSFGGDSIKSNQFTLCFLSKSNMLFEQKIYMKEKMCLSSGEVLELMLTHFIFNTCRENSMLNNVITQTFWKKW